MYLTELKTITKSRLFYLEAKMIPPAPTLTFVPGYMQYKPFKICDKRQLKTKSQNHKACKQIIWNTLYLWKNIIKIVPLWTKLPEFSFHLGSWSREPLAQEDQFQSQLVLHSTASGGNFVLVVGIFVVLSKTVVLILQIKGCWGNS